ncbi:hypothetical protein [Gracilimonas amylolytica]|uniref:hypothetical protein n=1 Tax=Gracilimonas amylolytica TaxID=1749045 RepID=UPI000CD9AD4D|nr:hypothetical protein [Gracilimonas amylolytica]
MMVQSPLKKHDVRPNLRKVEKPSGNGKIGSAPNGKHAGSSKVKGKITLPKIKPWKIIMGSIIIGILGFAYLTHVFSTQRLLEEVQFLEAEYNRSRAQFDELKLRYDRMVGPADIYDKAEAQGFINGGPADKVIVIKE